MLVCDSVVYFADSSCFELSENEIAAWEDFGSNYTFQFLIFPVVAPFAWLLSSSIHLSNIHLLKSNWFSHQHLFSCLVPHKDTAFMTDENILLLSLIGSLCFLLFYVVRLSQWNLGDAQVVQDSETQKRISRLIEETPILQGIDIILVEKWNECAATVGIFSPKIILHNSWVRNIDDSMLLATLLHEMAHGKQRDVARAGLMQIVLRLNCFRKYIDSSVSLWKEAREVYADKQAITWGANPLALAEAIVHALRWKKQYLGAGGTKTLQFSLGGTETDLLKLRLALLLDNVEAEPIKTRKKGLFSQKFILGMVWGFFILYPHILSWDVLDLFHYHIERIGLSIGGW